MTFIAKGFLMFKTEYTKMWNASESSNPQFPVQSKSLDGSKILEREVLTSFQIPEKTQANESAAKPSSSKEHKKRKTKKERKIEKKQKLLKAKARLQLSSSEAL